MHISLCVVSAWVFLLSQLDMCSVFAALRAGSLHGVVVGFGTAARLAGEPPECCEVLCGHDRQQYGCQGINCLYQLVLHAQCSGSGECIGVVNLL